MDRKPVARNEGRDQLRKGGVEDTEGKQEWAPAGAGLMYLNERMYAG